MRTSLSTAPARRAALRLAWACVVIHSSLRVASAADDGLSFKTLSTGVWVADQRTATQMGEALEFLGDGTLIYNFGPILDFRYDGQALYLQTRPEHLTPTPQSLPQLRHASQIQPYRFEGRNLVLNPDVPDKRIVLTRVLEEGEYHSRTITGTWSTPLRNGVTGLLRFDRDARAQMIIPLNRFPGTYSIKGELIRVRLAAGSDQLFAIRMVGDRLTVMNRKAGPRDKARTFSHFIDR